jgi:tRNA pseudouridine55 synthase
MKRKGLPLHGWLNLDKPLGMTSFKALAEVKRILNVSKLGHAGTLDPDANGILPIALGDATRLIEYCQDMDKAYRFTVAWGAATSTDDAAGEIIATTNHQPKEVDISSLIPAFIGDIIQIPPRYSALKIDGKRAYDLAREGADFDIKSRHIKVYDLKLIHHNHDSSDFEVSCGKGTYVRSLARDMGEKLGCLGHIKTLRRLKVGHFNEKNAFSLEALREIVHSSGVYAPILPLTTVLDDISALAVSASEAQRLRYGQTISTGQLIKNKITKAMLDDELVAIVNCEDLSAIKPVKVFNVSNKKGETDVDYS